MEEEPKIKIKMIKPKIKGKSKLIQEENPVEFTLKQEYIEKCENGDEKKCNEFMLKKELLERQELGNTPTENDFLYPDLNDPNFIIKIAEKKEFNDTKYDGEVYDIKKHAEVLANADFQLAPHQSFVRNFLSFQTPYNSLLLYHGLGSGKSLTAIGVSEEMRSYLKQIGMAKRIIVVASPNVQDNFRVQLFDERKLKLVNGLWNIKGAVGTNFLKEINPMNMKGLSKEKVISQIQSIIKHSYLFLGYQEFANYIEKTCLGGEYISRKKGESRKQIVKCIGSKRQQFALKQEFNNRLIVIDEIHNIRMSDDSENKIVAEQLMNVVKYADNLRLLFLSATPMYNSYTEIIWLLNIMNINDRRPTIDVSDVFDKNGEFKKNPAGKELLIRKATGYVSFVRGNNPYTFPYRVYPSIFSPKNTFPSVKYPKYQMNGKVIKPDDKIEILSLYLTQIGEYQSLGYKFIIDNLRNKNITTMTTKTGVVRQMPSFENIESFGYTLLQMPIEALNIVYPIEGLEEVVEMIRPVSNYSESDLESGVMRENSRNEVENLGAQVVMVNEPSAEPSVATYDFEPKGVGEKEKETEVYINSNDLTGNNGLKRIMSFVDSKNPPEKGSYEYKDTPFGHIFSQKELGKYSSKMKNICQHIISSTGIVLIYSQYIDGGIVPMALALEELGLIRYGKDAKNLFSNAPSEPLDFRTMKPREDKKDKGFKPVRYAMITGDTRISPNNDFEVKGLTDESNMDGSKIKVVLISRAGSEGIDLKCIRQVHILDPWYNMNRIEQIIGRAVRNSSHKALPFEERNVEIFLYGTILEDNEEESADLYVYRIAETKAVQIGKVSRVLKETSVDCILNHDQSNFTKENIHATLGKTYKQILSDGQVIPDFMVGDEPYSAELDYMKDGNYKCHPDKEITDEDLKENTYNEAFITMNSDKLLKKIRDLMRERYFYKKKELIQLLNRPKPFPIAQIYSALTQLIEDTNETILDKYGRVGYLVNIGEYYLFQPAELTDKHISIFDRSVPIDFKHGSIQLALPENEKVKEREKEKKREIKELEKQMVEQEKEGEKEKEGEGEEQVQVQVQVQVEEELQQPIEEKQQKAQSILRMMRENYDTAVEYSEIKEKIPRGDDNWYKHCGKTMQKIHQDYGVPKEELKEFLLQHLVDMLIYDEKLELLETKSALNYDFTQKVMDIFQKKIMKTKRFEYIILFENNSKRQIMVLNAKTGVWSPAEPEDELEVEEQIIRSLPKEIPYNDIIGFISYEQKNRYLVFKTKHTKLKRNVGARCDESGKTKKLQVLNEILDEKKYTKETSSGMVQQELCSLQEFLLRYYQKIQKNDKVWFLDFETAMLYGL
jgi:superfamily II DNA or RNA helicase